MKLITNIRIVLISSLVLFLCASTVGVTRVGQGAAPQGTLQDMIDAAPDGGTVNIPAGTYSETLTVDKNLTLSGVSASLTILQPASTNQRVIAVTTGHNLTLGHLRVTGGHPTAAGGGGVYMAAGGSLTLDTVKIDHNQATYGGGIYQEGTAGSVTASNCMFSDNTASFSGGGVYTGGSATLSNTTLANNTATNHGGGLHVGSGTASLTGGAVYGNHALNGNGGGVNVADGLTVVGTTFYSNTAAGTGDASGSGGAVSQWNPNKTVSISGATFNVNAAQVNGGAVYVRESYLTLANSTFTGNTANSSSTTMTFGGGVYAGGGIDGSFLTFTNNATKCDGCGSYEGGGLYITNPTVKASSVTQSTFDGNHAWMGSGIKGYPTIQLTLTQCSFINNGSLTGFQMLSGYGGGVMANWVHGDQLLFQNNQAMRYGGGLFVGETVLTNSRFIDNITDSTGKGGGVSVGVSIDGTNLLFDSNEASSGAALYIGEAVSAVLRHATIGRPTRGTGSAILLYTNATLEMKNSTITAYDEGVHIQGTLNEDYNLLFNNGTNFAVYGTFNPGGHSISGHDPLFADLAAGNYHLRLFSPAIGLGTNLGVTIDLDSRPRIGRWDSGAYQFYTFIYLPVISK
jgi:predicted outer membrane repeat protein